MALAALRSRGLQACSRVALRAAIAPRTQQLAPAAGAAGELCRFQPQTSA